MFILHEKYNRKELHGSYGGQSRGGISTPSEHNFIMLFTGESGRQYGYKDRWSEDGLFLYTGEGQVGDMEFIRGNKAILEHAEQGKDLYLFEYVARGYVQYLGQMVCRGYEKHNAPDRDGNDRQVIVFKLAPVASLDSTLIADDEAHYDEWYQEPLEVLRKRAYAASTTGRSTRDRSVAVIDRNRNIRRYVLKRANGVCESCGNDAPFMTSAGRPYLEHHHIQRLSDAGLDDIGLNSIRI